MSSRNGGARRANSSGSSDETRLRARLARIEQQIARLNPRDPYLDELARYFPGGRVGGSGRHGAALNARRERAMDRSIEAARKAEPLYSEANTIRRQLDDITSGRAATRAAGAQSRVERVRAAKAGDTVVDSALGHVTVVRVNQKTLTIETPSGYREARPYSQILDVVRTSAPKAAAEEAAAPRSRAGGAGGGGRAKATGEAPTRTPRSSSTSTRTRASKAERATAATATPKSPRQTLTSARAALRDLTSKVNAADAEVNRAVNAPRDTQDFSRSYRAWQAAIEERDRFFNSLTPEMAAKLRSSEPTPRGSSSGTGTARLNVRASTYNGQSGFTIRGTDTLGRSVSIFSTSRAEAERMRNQIKAGQEPTFDKQRKGA